jgi:hypothetical protein
LSQSFQKAVSGTRPNDDRPLLGRQVTVFSMISLSVRPTDKVWHKTLPVGRLTPFL